MHKSQQGSSYLWTMVQVFMVVLIAKAALSLIPAYLDDRIINGQIKEMLQKQPNLSLAEFAEDANRRFEINSVRDLKFNDIAKINVQADGHFVVQKNYEIREPYLSNIDLVLHFEKSFDQNSIKTE